MPKSAPAPAQPEPTEPIPLFNFKPAKGIAAMIAAGLVEDRPEAIAQALIDNKELQARYVGLYLSDPSEKASAVREAFGTLVINESFRNLGFVDALREYLSRFVMPGEAAQIERILATFAVRFYSLNGESLGLALRLIFLYRLFHPLKSSFSSLIVLLRSISDDRTRMQPTYWPSR